MLGYGFLAFYFGMYYGAMTIDRIKYFYLKFKNFMFNKESENIKFPR